MRLCWYGQMVPGYMLPEQMLPCQFASVIEGTGNLPLKFGQNWISDSLDIFCWLVVGGCAESFL